jgi:hypothetical protein
MSTLDNAEGSWRSLRNATGERRTTCSHCLSLIRLHSWPGQEPFDDEDEDEFSDWDGDSDLPGLRMVHF